MPCRCGPSTLHFYSLPPLTRAAHSPPSPSCAQLLKVAGRGSPFEVFCHWGKVGVAWHQECSYRSYSSSKKTNFNVYVYDTEEAAVDSFKAWFKKKGGCAWEDRANFQQRPEMCACLSCTSPGSGHFLLALLETTSLPTSD